MSSEQVDSNPLQRFVLAQDEIYDQALAELRAGCKRSHWMWFVFPQIAGLGRSERAQFYAIQNLDEARAYLSHPQLGPRLTECVAAVLTVERRSAREIFGSTDDLKFCSSLTLFEQVAGRDSLFSQALGRFYEGRRDAVTRQLLNIPPACS